MTYEVSCRRNGPSTRAGPGGRITPIAARQTSRLLLAARGSRMHIAGMAINETPARLGRCPPSPRMVRQQISREVLTPSRGGRSMRSLARTEAFANA